MSEPTFVEWLWHVFDHPVTSPEWHWGIDAEPLHLAPDRTVEYLQRLFSNPVPALRQYSDAQINQGLHYLVSSECSDYAFALLESNAPWPARRECIRAIFDLFEQLFAPRCAEHLSHLDRGKGKSGGASLDAVCYMWWDCFPTWGQPEESEQAEFDAKCLAVMGRILSLGALSCQESALHGLGHWHLHYPKQAEKIIDRFLEKREPLPNELREYAKDARCGFVQ